MADTSGIRSEMEVVASDGKHLGKVDHVEGGQIDLVRFGFGSGLNHHSIPTSWVDHVDDKVHLNLTNEQAKAQLETKH